MLLLSWILNQKQKPTFHSTTKLNIEVVVSYELKTGDAEGRATNWMARFIAYSGWMDFTLPEEKRNWSFQQWLDYHNAKASDSKFVNIGDPLVFETEGDALFFIIRWSE